MSHDLTPESAPSPTEPGTSPEAGPGRSTRVRPGTIVWGLVVALLGTAVVAWGQGLRFDLQLASIGVLAAAGAVLVVTSLARSRDRTG